MSTQHTCNLTKNMNHPLSSRSIRPTLKGRMTNKNLNKINNVEDKSHNIPSSSCIYREYSHPQPACREAHIDMNGIKRGMRECCFGSLDLIRILFDYKYFCSGVYRKTKDEIRGKTTWWKFFPYSLKDA